MTSQPAMQPVMQPLRLAGIALLSGLLLWLGFLVYGSTGHDDSHITFWAANSLLNYGDILNYNGERVEQSSSLLLTVLIATISGITHLPIVISGYLIAIAASLLTCVLLAHITAYRQAGFSWWSVLLLGSSASFLLWTFSGMESTLTALCLLWMLSAWARWITGTSSPVAAIISAAALMMVRPEMPAIVVALSLSLLPVYRQRAVSLLVFSLTLVAILALCRYQYFGNVFPQPVTAKLGSALQLKTGVYYLLFSGTLNPVMFIGSLIAFTVCGKHYWHVWCATTAPDNTASASGDFSPTHSKTSTSPFTLLCANSLLIYLGFIWLNGGDWMQAGRFLVPVIPVACVLVLHAAAMCNQRQLTHLLLLLLCAGQMWIQVPTLATLSHGTPVWVQYRLDERFAHYSVFEQWNQEHVRDMAVIDHLQTLVNDLTQQRTQPVTVLSGQSGMVFYYTAQQFFRHVLFYDLRGLVDTHLTDCPLLVTVERSRQGLFWGYPDFFALLPQLEAQCGIHKPDIIYDLNDMSQKLGQTLEQYGYVMVHQEQGFVLENTTTLPWNRLLSPNMIFIRQDLLPLLRNPEKRIVRYPDYPLKTRNLTWTPY